MVKTLERDRYALCEKHVIVPFCCSYQVYRYLAGCFGLISCRHYLRLDGDVVRIVDEKHYKLLLSREIDSQVIAERNREIGE